MKKQQMRKDCHKIYFTLLEIIVTIALVTICFSVIGINVSEALYKHNYETCVKKMERYFDFCGKMAFSNQADVYLKLSQKGQDIYYEMGTDENMGFFENMKTTKDCFRDARFLFNDKKAINLEIVFSSTGEVLPKGNITFLDKKNKIKQIKTLKVQDE